MTRQARPPGLAGPAGDPPPDRPAPTCQAPAAQYRQPHLLVV